MQPAFASLSLPVSLTHQPPPPNPIARQCNLVEPWYSTQFGVTPISAELLSACARAKDHPAAIAHLRWPLPNPFIPTDFTLVCDSEEFKAQPPPPKREGPVGVGALSVSPRLLREDGLAAVWHKTDSTFRRPKSHLFMDIVVPAVYASPEASSLTRLFFRLVNDELTEFVYDAELGGLGYSLTIVTSGLRLNVAGYNHKLPVLLSRVLDRLRSPQVRERSDRAPLLFLFLLFSPLSSCSLLIPHTHPHASLLLACAQLDKERFDIQRELQLKEHSNFFKSSPVAQIRYATSHLIELSRWHLLEYISFISSPQCTHEALCAFARGSLLSSLHMSVFMHGNASEATSLSLIADAAATLGALPLRLSQLPAPRVLQLPEGVEVMLRLHPSLCSPEHLAMTNKDEVSGQKGSKAAAGPLRTLCTRPAPSVRIRYLPAKRHLFRASGGRFTRHATLKRGAQWLNACLYLACTLE